MKIALVTDQPGAPSPAAAQEYPADPGVLPLAGALAGLGQQVSVYTPQDSAEPRESRADKPLEHIAAFARKLTDRWSADPPDVIHAHLWTSGLAALAGARGLGIPVVQTFSPLGADARPDRVLASASATARVRLERAIGRSAGAVIARTPHERAALARLGVPQQSLRVVPAGVDTTRFSPSEQPGQRGERPRLLLVSPPGDPRGPATAMQALADTPGAELVIAGDPGDEAITRLACKLGVHDRVSCAGPVTEAEMPSLMRSADMLVHLTPSQRFAIVPVEAMASGLPVVASWDAAPGDAIIDGITGFLVSPAQPAQLARRVRQLLASPMLLEGYGIAAASRARSRYSWERVAQETLTVYEELAGPAIEAAA
jgi:glycosyltransferase involved in cell wall biosynthesis